MNTWEVCPKCKGNKTVYVNTMADVSTLGSGIVGYVECTICDGKGIISSLTGLPPKSQKSNWSNVDFSREVEDLIHK